MNRDLKALSNETFDVLVIGGGITGACIALDAQTRGLKTALIEKGDFGGATSAASSKLLHGGIRYLQQGRLDKVMESAKERAIFQNLAPHLTQYVPFIIPTYQRPFMKTQLAMGIGLQCYEWLCWKANRQIAQATKKVPPNARLTRKELLEITPLLQSEQELTGARVLWESHMIDSERMTLLFLRTAVKEGARAANYVRAEKLLKDKERVVGVRAVSRLGDENFDIRARLVINAAGPFIPSWNSENNLHGMGKMTTGFSKGIHLVTDQILSRYALALPTRHKSESLLSRGGRHFFLIPWRGCTLIGTTNVPFADSLDKVVVTEKDVHDFISEINRTLPNLGLQQKQIRYAFAGLYPLTASEIKPGTYQGTGDYQVIDHTRWDGIQGMLSVLGAKYTTARKVAEKAIDLALAKIGLKAPKAVTAMRPLWNAAIPNLRGYIREQQATYRESLDAETVSHLITLYGQEAEAVIHQSQVENKLVPLCKERQTILGEVSYAVRQEMAMRLEDVLFRRTGLGTIGHPGQNVLAQVAAEMGGLLNWDAARRDKEIADVNDKYIFKKD